MSEIKVSPTWLGLDKHPYKPDQAEEQNDEKIEPEETEAPIENPVSTTKKEELGFDARMLQKKLEDKLPKK